MAPHPTNGDDSAERRSTLLSMLQKSEARRERLSRRRLPALAPGVRISIRAGVHANSEGIILDADFIENRVLVDTPDTAAPVWIDFQDLAPPFSAG